MFEHFMAEICVYYFDIYYKFAIYYLIIISFFLDCKELKVAQQGGTSSC